MLVRSMEMSPNVDEGAGDCGRILTKSLVSKCRVTIDIAATHAIFAIVELPGCTCDIHGPAAQDIA